jgi:hypothetical protein
MGQHDDFVSEDLSVSCQDVQRRQTTERTLQDWRAEGVVELIVGGIKLDLLLQLNRVLVARELNADGLGL